MKALPWPSEEGAYTRCVRFGATRHRLLVDCSVHEVANNYYYLNYSLACSANVGSGLSSSGAPIALGLSGKCSFLRGPGFPVFWALSASITLATFFLGLWPLGVELAEAVLAAVELSQAIGEMVALVLTCDLLKAGAWLGVRAVWLLLDRGGMQRAMVTYAG